jgi:histidine triad (HIT) family protein
MQGPSGGQPGRGQGQQQNIFYRLATGDVPSKTVFENDEFRAILDKEPVTRGHVLILPKKQVQITPQFTPEMNEGLAEAVQEVSQLLLKGVGADGTNVFVANGAVAGQNAPHVLVHVIPRYENDGLGLNPQPKQISDEAFEEAAERLQAALGVQGEEGSRRGDSEPEPHREEPSDSDVDLDEVQDRFL